MSEPKTRYKSRYNIVKLNNNKLYIGHSQYETLNIYIFARSTSKSVDPL